MSLVAGWLQDSFNVFVDFACFQYKLQLDHSTPYHVVGE